MGTGKQFAFAAVSLLVAACGGSTFDTAAGGTGGSGASTGGSTSAGGSTGTGGSTDTGGSGNAGGSIGAGGSAGSGGTGGAISDAGESCTVLYDRMNAKLAEAQICIGSVQNECQVTVRGMCGCPAMVASPDSAITAEYLKALDNYNAQCPHSCPAMPCGTLMGSCGAASGTGVRRCVLRTAVDGG